MPTVVPSHAPHKDLTVFAPSSQTMAMGKGGREGS
ncbi:hypothetical protein QF035_008868 [Streptomyces umbrinus]|uniref:Uncharacterized protein n=1 Tax=Streptomyces umbrinus TaxID=67370 RepID=A0ABU0T8I5_9ACTN|nr:hypothetical protein [Streptomyces umbrinus]